MAETQSEPLSPPIDDDRELLQDYSSIIQRNLENLFSFAHEHGFSYGELYEHTAGGTTISLPTANSFEKWISGTQGEISSTRFIQVTPDSFIIKSEGSGIYEATFDTSFSGSTGSTIHGAIFVNGSEVAKSEFHRKLGGSDVGAASSGGFLSLNSGDIIDLRFSSDTASDSITVEHINFRIKRISREF